jgi:hypothetical protein
MITNPLGLIKESVSGNDTKLASYPVVMRESQTTFFQETLYYLSEMNIDMYEANRQFYISVLEADQYSDMTVVHESFGDFFDKIKEIIDKFLNFIKSLFERFLTLLNKMIGRDKYIINHKKDFDKFTSIHQFNIEGFEYTIHDGIPIVEAQAEFTKEFVFDLGSGNQALTFGGGKAPSDNIKDATAALSRELSDGEYYDKLRATVIAQDTPITKDDFADELFSTFRNGESIADTIEVDAGVVHESLTRFSTSKSDIEKAKKTKARIDSEYTSIRKSVEKMVTLNRSNSAKIYQFDDRLGEKQTLTDDQIIYMDNFIKAKVSQIQEMSNIHALAFAAKLDAMTDCYKQDKNILFTALSKVQSGKKEEI